MAACANLNARAAGNCHRAGGGSGRQSPAAQMGAYFSLRAPTRRPRRHRGGDRQGGELKSPECDVTNLSSVEALAALVEAESGRVDIW